MNLGRYLRTMRYLKPVQIYGRLWHRLHRPAPDLRDAPTLRRLPGKPVAGADRQPSMVGPGVFRFLNVEGRVNTAADWNDTGRPPLWRYNLHYFDDLNARDAGARDPWHSALIDRWIVENPPARGIGWDSYPISLRIVNWIKWLSRRAEAPAPEVARSLAVQTRYLRRRLEHHLQGNHLWANGKALAFAGVFFGGDEGDAWLQDGLRIIDRELTEEILADGGHFERSPMYHSIILEDVLDLLAFLRLIRNDALEQQLSRTAEAMFHWLQVMTHPDGEIAQFNDAALGVAPNHASLRDYGDRVGVATSGRALRDIEVLAESGYARLSNDRAVVLCDVAPLGPDYLPGHAHADTLTFELSLDGARVIVDGGTSTYDSGGQRHRERGTTAHNTVIVNETDSSEVWSSFRVGRRARVRNVQSGRDAGAVWLSASHDGYRHMAPPVVHSRRWTLASSSLTISDTIAGAPRDARALLHLHPSLSPRLDAGAVSVGDGRLTITHDPVSAVELVPDNWSPEFGKTLPSTTVATRLRDRLTTTIAWT